MSATPPFELLVAVDLLLTTGGVPYALGGSGLLFAHALVDRVGDWDLTTDAPPVRVVAALHDLELERVGPGGVHADEKVRLYGGAVEVIVGMAIHSRNGVCRIPTLASGNWRGIPLGSLEAWAVAYTLLDRPGRAGVVFDHLQAAGADQTAIAGLLRQPLPDELAARLSRLPERAAS